MSEISAGAKKALATWKSAPLDDATRASLEALEGQGDSAIEDCFGSQLRFGTAGMRGLMGVGPARLNRYTVTAAAEGLARYIATTEHQGTASVLIGYDNRHHSREFAEVTARVCAAHGYRVWLFREIRPIPWVSFGVRHLHCTAGVMITASHNPSAYNGFKVFWSDGAQVLPPHDQGIMDQVRAISEPWKIPLAPLESPLISWIDEELDEAYIQAIYPLQNSPTTNQAKGKELKVVYTPLHGTGGTVIERVLGSWGFLHLSLVAEQMIPDGDFPTASYPNPEKAEAMALAVAQLEREQADLVIANDPDADRIGMGCRTAEGVRRFTGNEMAVIALDYLCRAKKRSHPAGEGPLGAVKTIVTTEAFRAVASSYGVECADVLTGFKYIGQQIERWQATGGPQFLFGGEESYGCLYGTHARDKDGLSMAALLCEIALDCKGRGQTLADYLDQIEQQIGIYRNAQKSLEFPDTEAGHQQMERVMARLRQEPPRSLGGFSVERVTDYEKQKIRNLTSGAESSLEGFPPSDVLQYDLTGGSGLIIRPSGTEPKVKLYGSVRIGPEEVEDLPRARREAEEKVAALLEALATYAEQT